MLAKSNVLGYVTSDKGTQIPIFFIGGSMPGGERITFIGSNTMTTGSQTMSKRSNSYMRTFLASWKRGRRDP